PPTRDEIALAALRSTARQSNFQPFFTHKRVDQDDDSEGSDEGSDQEEEVEEDSGNESEGPEMDKSKEKAKAKGKGKGKGRAKEKNAPKYIWFPQPQTMPNFLYSYFIDVVHGLVTQREASSRAFKRPELFKKTKSKHASLWLVPPDPTFALASHSFIRKNSLLPRVFLWLPRFLVNFLACPRCGRALDKNGLIPPRRITDVEDNFYIVTWQYYCRHDGCKKTYRGWSPSLLDSLPGTIRLAFPAVLSRKRGLSLNVMTQLRVCNQHKMGPAGVRSLLVEAHTLKFN
ncbi:hypothetical protein P7C70_g5366, partial [Phenoliferia sp. Uapishka_3]